jgi:hypothetical protein
MKLFLRALMCCVLLSAGWVGATTYYIDFDNGNDSNSGTSTNAPWRTLPGTQNLAGTDWLHTSWGNGAITALSKIPAGSVIQIKAGTTYDSRDGGIIWLERTWYPEIASDYGSITIERATNWGSGPVTFDFTGIVGLAAVIVQIDGLRLDGHGTSGIRVINSPQDGIQVKEKMGTGNAVSYTFFESLEFYNNGTSFLNDPAGAGSGQVNFRKVSSARVNNCIFNGNNRFINGLIQGDNHKQIVDSVVSNSEAYGHQGDMVTNDAGIGFKVFNGQVLFTNVFSHHNLKGFDLGEQHGDNGTITYRVVNCTSHDNAWGVNFNCAADATYTGAVNFYLINTIIYSNLVHGANVYSSPFNLHVIHSVFAYNGTEAQSGSYSGNLRITPNSATDSGHIVARVYNNVFYKGWDCAITTSHFDTAGGTDFTLDEDYNVYVQRASEMFCQWAYFQSGAAVNVAYGADGPGHASGQWYSRAGVSTATPTLGTGHLGCDAHSTVILSSVPVEPFFRTAVPAAYVPSQTSSGFNLSNKSWYTPEMGLDRMGHTRASWAIGPYESAGPVVQAPTGLRVLATGP